MHFCFITDELLELYLEESAQSAAIAVHAVELVLVGVDQVEDFILQMFGGEVLQDVCQAEEVVCAIGIFDWLIQRVMLPVDLEYLALQRWEVVRDIHNVLLLRALATQVALQLEVPVADFVGHLV